MVRTQRGGPGIWAWRACRWPEQRPGQWWRSLRRRWRQGALLGAPAARSPHSGGDATVRPRVCRGGEGAEPARLSACCPQAPSLGCPPGPFVQGPHNWAEAGSWEWEGVVLSALLPHLQACRTLLGRWWHRGGRAYRWLTEYLPEWMVNQMKELSSIAYTWGGGEHLSQQLWGLTVPPPGGRESGRPRHPQACSSLLPVQGEPAGPQDPGGGGPRGTRAVGGGAVRATVKARPRPISVETMFPCTLRKLWIPRRQSWAEGSVWAWTAPPSPGTAPSQGVWGRSGHWDPG